MKLPDIPQEILTTMFTSANGLRQQHQEAGDQELADAYHRFMESARNIHSIVLARKLGISVEELEAKHAEAVKQCSMAKDCAS